MYAATLGNGQRLIPDRHDVVEIAAATRSASWRRVADASLVKTPPLDADLVVDAMGRAAAHLRSSTVFGYGRPEEDRIAVQLCYASWLLRILAIINRSDRRKSRIAPTAGRAVRMRT